MFSTGVGLVLKGFEKKIKNSSNENLGNSVDETPKEKTSNSLIAKFTSFFEDDID